MVSPYVSYSCLYAKFVVAAYCCTESSSVDGSTVMLADDEESNSTDLDYNGIGSGRRARRPILSFSSLRYVSPSQRQNFVMQTLLSKRCNLFNLHLIDTGKTAVNYETSGLGKSKDIGLSVAGRAFTFETIIYSVPVRLMISMRQS